MATYTFLIADLMTGEVLSDLDFSTFAWDEVYNRPGGFDATIGVRAPKVSRSLLRGMQRSVWATANSTVLFGGVLGPLEAKSDDNVLSLGGQGFLSLYRDGRRTIRSRLGMSHATGPLASDVQWSTAVDLFEVVEDLFAHAAAIGGAADFGLALRLNGPAGGGYSGRNLPGAIELTTEDKRDIADVLDELIDLEHGIDIALAFAWESTNVLKPTLELHWPSVGRATNYVLEADKNVTIIDWQEDPAGLANYVEASGAGEGDTMVRAVAQDTAARYPAGRYPLLERHLSHKTATSADYLRAIAQGNLTVSAIPRETLTLRVIDDASVPPGALRAGDFVTVAARDGIYELDGVWRVMAIRSRIEDGVLSRDVGLVPATFYDDLI